MSLVIVNRTVNDEVGRSTREGEREKGSLETRAEKKSKRKGPQKMLSKRLNRKDLRLFLVHTHTHTSLLVVAHVAVVARMYK